MGPSIGAVFCQIDTTIHGLNFNANNAPAFLILVAVVIMFLQVCFAIYIKFLFAYG